MNLPCFQLGAAIRGDSNTLNGLKMDLGEMAKRDPDIRSMLTDCEQMLASAWTRSGQGSEDSCSCMS